MALTERRIRDAKPGSKLTFIWDKTVKGLGVRVTPKGSKSFVLSYRVNGSKRIVTLARCEQLSLIDARKRAGRLLVEVRDGVDPLRREQETATPTVADLVRRFLEQEAPARIKRGRLKERTRTWYRHLATAHVLPALGKHEVAKVTRGDVEHAVAELSDASRNATLALLSRLFTLAEHWEWRDQRTNPARGVERARQDARDRVLSPSELAALAGALDNIGPRAQGSVAAIRFAALTGLRIGEVLAVRWEHVNIEAGRLLLPDTKTGRRQHDLPTPARELLAGTASFNGGSGWVFTNDGKAPCTYKRVRGCLDRATKAAGLDNVKLHDLRRTVMTNAAAAGVGTYVLRDLLGHRTTAMADRYVRAVGNPVRDAREQVAGQMAAMMQGTAAPEVVPLRGRNDRR